MKKKWVGIAITIIIVLSLGGFVWYKLSQTESTSKAQLTKEDLRARMIMKVKKSNLTKTVEASGTVESVESQELYFKTKGTIEKINIEEGAKVEEGQVLMEISDTKQQLSYLQAKNKYETAKINGASAEIKEAQLNLELAEDDLEDTKLEAPFTGVVNEISVEEDSYTELELDKAVAKIIDDSNYQVEINIDESSSRELAVGQKSKISLEALPNQQFAGKVVDIGANAGSESGVVTLPVTVSITETPEFIRPGFSADVEVIVNQSKEQLLVPITAIFNEQGQTKVVKIVQGAPEPVNVKTGITNGEKIVIKSGLEVGDQILINAFKFANSSQNSKQSENGGLPQGGGRMMRGGSR